MKSYLISEINSEKRFSQNTEDCKEHWGKSGDRGTEHFLCGANSVVMRGYTDSFNLRREKKNVGFFFCLWPNFRTKGLAKAFRGGETILLTL